MVGSRSRRWWIWLLIGCLIGVGIGIRSRYEGFTWSSGRVDVTTPPVYNVIVDPLPSRDPLRIETDRPTRLELSIGPYDPTSVLGDGAEFAGTGLVADVPQRLIAVLDCPVCVSQTESRVFRYDPAVARSDTAVFEFVVASERADSVGGLMTLAITVYGSVQPLDRIELTFLSDSVSELAREEYTRPGVYPATSPRGDRSRDLLVVVGRGEGEGLEVDFIPENPFLAEHLRRFPLESLQLEITVGAVEDRQEWIYRALSEMVTFFREAPLDLSSEPEASRQIGERLEAIGGSFYEHVFQNEAVSRVVASIEYFGRSQGLPLRVDLHNSGPWLPWQLLDSPHAADSAWGVHFDLAVEQYFPGKPTGSVPQEPILLQPGEVLVGHGADQVWSRPGSALAAYLTEQVVDGVRSERRLRPFVTYLRERGADLGLILFLTDGSSDGPWLCFGDEEAFTPDSISPRKGLLRRRPLVVLSGPETGTGGEDPTSEELFVGRFLTAGAGAVVATEAEVAPALALRVARDLAAGLDAGYDVSTALGRVRRAHARDLRNPLSLLFSLYGVPGLRFVVSPPGDAVAVERSDLPATAEATSSSGGSGC